MLQDCNDLCFSDLHAISHNSGKLNASAKTRASHYRVGYALSAGIANWKFIFLRGMPPFLRHGHMYLKNRKRVASNGHKDSLYPWVFQ